MDISIFICWMASLCLFTVNSNASLSIVLIGSNSSLLSSEWSPSFLRIGSRKWSKGFTTNSMQNERKDKVAPQTRIKKAAIHPETKVIHPKYYNHLKENSQHSYFFIQSSMYSHTKTLISERNDSWLGRWLEFLCTRIYKCLSRFGLLVPVLALIHSSSAIWKHFTMCAKSWFVIFQQPQSIVAARQ